jgi:hypothetical protein
MITNDSSISFEITSDISESLSEIIYNQNLDLLKLIIKEYNLNEDEVLKEFTKQKYWKLPSDKKIKFSDKTKPSPSITK